VSTEQTETITVTRTFIDPELKELSVPHEEAVEDLADTPAKRPTRSQRYARANSRLRQENEDLKAELAEQRELLALALQNLDIYRRKNGIKLEEMK
jgi:hypothetical protein